MFMNSNMKMKFKPAEFQNFNWLFNIAPCFPLNASKVNVINDPSKFYDTLTERFKNAKSRISVASLYIGTGPLEKKLLQETKENLLQNRSLQFNVLLDYQRGTRGIENSASLLRDFLQHVPDQCNISLYQTPRLQGSWSKALPSRYNEIIGLQHMKLYIADDSVMLSGANCSHDYFTQRQDRYIEIQDQDLANFYSELIGEVSNLSKKCDKDVILDSKMKKDELIKEIQGRVEKLIHKWKIKQDAVYVANDIADTGSKADTWVFPLLQMGEFNVKQDELSTQCILASAPENSTVRLATGYFNLTDQYADTLLNDCKANVSLLMAHPNANGFKGAAGPAGGIPHAYSLIARKFWQRVAASGQARRVQLQEYERDGWTFHAKGLWYYPAGGRRPCATLVGSANLGARSVRRDLEAQAAIFTVSPQLQQALHEECSQLHAHASECSQRLAERRAPLWVHATVGLFRSYF